MVLQESLSPLSLLLFNILIMGRSCVAEKHDKIAVKTNIQKTNIPLNTLQSYDSVIRGPRYVANIYGLSTSRKLIQA